jgi:hypothetical protein
MVAMFSAYFDAGAIGIGIGMATTFPFISLEFGGEDNLPGIARGYLVRVSDIDTEAKPTASPTTDLERMKIVGSHSLAAGKYWAKIYSTLGKGNLKYENEGTRDFENFKTTGILFYPSTRKEAIAMSSAILGQDLIILLEENSESEYYLQVGTRKLPARVVSAGDWGSELNGEKGITFNIEAFHGKKPVYFYDGLIPLSADTEANESPFS